MCCRGDGIVCLPPHPLTPLPCAAIANMVCQDGRPNPNTLAVSRDGCRLAFVGPSKYKVTVVESDSLDEVSVGPPWSRFLPG